jgi:hypothetical protein
MGGIYVSRLNLNQAYLDQLRKRYAKASKKGRSVILDEFVATIASTRLRYYVGTAAGWRRGDQSC